MKKIITILSVFYIFNVSGQLKQVTIESLLSTNINIRALTLEKNILYFAGTENQFGKINLRTNKYVINRIIKDTLKLDFRNIAQTDNNIFILSISNPALLYKIDKKTFQPKLVYEEYNPKVFYDSMQFQNNNFGMAVGDPIDQTFCIITTIDGGNTWQKQLSENTPHNYEGESMFASSNTCLVVRDKKIWFSTGGSKARVYINERNSNKWQVSDTPIQHGNTMKGIFSMAFYDDNSGIVAGGDYEKQSQNISNKAITTDGGKNWQLVGEKQELGYISCVQYIKNSKGNKIVAISTMGVYYSTDGGNTWIQLTAEKNLHTIKIINSKNFIVAGKNKILRISF